MINKVLKMIFLISISISILFSNIFAFSGVGLGTSLSPFNITTCEQFQEINNNLTATYQLVNGIDCTLVTDFQRIGSCDGPVCNGVDNPFEGDFNGRNNVISNVNLVNLTTSDVGWGIFGYSTGMITNVHVEDSIINVSSNRVGGPIGVGDIYNSSFSGSVSGNDYVGGLAGIGDIYNSSFSGSVSGNNIIGGLVGNSGDIYNSSFSGIISGNNQVGGLTGISYSANIINNYVQADINANNRVGGLVGWDTSFSTIENNGYFGDVSGNNSVGGLIGETSSGFSTSYSSGSVSGNNSVGGLVGTHSSGDVSDSFTVSEVTGINTSSTGTLFGEISSVNVTNIYWNNISSNPNNAVGVGSNENMTSISDDLAYFYNPLNPPLNSFPSEFWNFTGTDLPFLIGQDNPFSSSTPSSPQSPTSLFPQGSFTVPLFILLAYFLL